MYSSFQLSDFPVSSFDGLTYCMYTIRNVTVFKWMWTLVVSHSNNYPLCILVVMLTWDIKSHRSVDICTEHGKDRNHMMYGYQKIENMD